MFDVAFRQLESDFRIKPPNHDLNEENEEGNSVPSLVRRTKFSLLVQSRDTVE